MMAAAAAFGELLTLAATLSMSRELDIFYAHESPSLSKSFYVRRE